MPRLPDLDSLGERPTPQSRRGVASNPRAGIVADAASRLGDTVSKIGFDKMAKDDAFRYEMAKGGVIAKEVEARQTFEQDPDYTTILPRYDAHMKDVAGKFTTMIQSNSDRRRFEVESASLLARGRAEVAGIVRGKQVKAELSLYTQDLDNRRVVALAATDDATRADAISGALAATNAARDRGLLDPLEAQKIGKQWVSGYVSDQTDSLLNRDDVDGAKSFFGKYGHMIDGHTRTVVEGRLIDASNNREKLLGIDAIAGAATRTGDAPVAYADPLRGKSQRMTSAYGVARATGPHNGTDFAAPVGTPVYSIAAGVVKQVSSDGRSGQFVVVDHGDGRVSSYSHLGAQAVKPGDMVTPDTQIGSVGMTGRTTGPHLHLVVRENGGTIDPQKVIGAAQSPRRTDLSAWLKQVDVLADTQNWSPEKREDWKQEAIRRASREDALDRREEGERMRSALDVVDSLADGFTDVSQIPGFHGLAPDDRLALRNRAEANRAPKSVPANGDVAVSIERFSIAAPDAFIKEDLRRYQHQMTPGEYASLLITQEKMKAEGASGKTTSIRSNINGTIDFYTKTDKALEKALDAKKNPAAFMKVFKDMEGYVQSITKGQREPSDGELETAFKRATMTVFVDGEAKRRDELPGNAAYQVRMPIDVRKRIIASWRRAHGGDEPPDGVVGDIYVQHKGKAGFWK